MDPDPTLLLEFGHLRKLHLKIIVVKLRRGGQTDHEPRLPVEPAGTDDQPIVREFPSSRRSEINMD
jgi:hypothetical protein